MSTTHTVCPRAVPEWGRLLPNELLGSRPDLTTATNREIEFLYRFIKKAVPAGEVLSGDGCV
jgi:hypothetical protein